MGEVPTELAFATVPPITDNDRIGSYLRQYDVFVETTTQMLATPRLNERLLLALEGISNIFGHRQAAVAIINERDAELRVRAAVGFEGDPPARADMPLDSSAACVRVIHDATPLWISIKDDAASRTLFDKLHWEHDVLALPLFGISEIAPTRGREKGSPRLPGHFWTFDPGARLGVLYVGANKDTVDPLSLSLLKRFADRVGIISSLAVHQEKLVSTVTKLQRERQWIESIMKSVADPIVLTDLDNEILLQNRRAEELFSGSANAGEGKRRALKLNDLLFSAYLSSATVSSSELVQRDITLVDPIEGSDLHFEVISTPAANARGEPLGLVSIFRDVTDLREANEELARNFGKLQQAEADSRRERDRLDLIIENVGHPIVVCDSAGNFILFNRRAELLFEEKFSFRQAAAGAVRTNAVKLTSFISGLASASETGRQAEIELIDPDTGSFLPMEITAREVLDPTTGQVTAVVSILHDLTEIRELERRRVEQQLFESEKLAAVGRLAASIAHEVNNPLEAIKNALYLMESGSEGDKNSRFLEIARKETERVSHIIRQMLGFARRSGEVDWVDVNQLIEETLVLLEKKMRQLRIRVNRDFDDQLPQIRARADQLRQVVLNLIINAQQAIQGGGEITISTARYEQALQPSILIQLSDTGVGITEDDLNRIFEPFFSSGKKGTGLGLWVTQDIVRQHGGRIEVASEVSRGTVFTIVLQVEPPIFEAQETESRLSTK